MEESNMKMVAASGAAPALPAPAFRLTWKPFEGRYAVNKAGINDTDCYTADQMLAALASREASSATISSEQARMLADALGRCIAASGIVRDDIDGFSGPQLLMFADDLCEMLKQRNGHEAVATAPSLREQGFHDWFAANYSGDVFFSAPRWHSDKVLQQARRALASLQAAPAPKMDDMATLIRRLVRELRKAAPSNDLAEKALDYLKRTGLDADVMRSDADPVQAAPRKGD